MIKKSKKISLIIPFFNGAKYLKRLMKILHYQSFREVQYILVNDGSTDNSLKIINKFLAKNVDSRFEIISKKNGGVSSARNIGLKKAIGEYVMFMDVDDTCDNNYIENYYKKIVKENADIVFFNANVIRKNQRKNELYNTNQICGKCNGKRFIFLYAKQKIRCYPFLYICKRKLWSHIEFDENFKYQEDTLALMTIIINNPNLNIFISDESYYNYILNEESAVHSLTELDYWQGYEVDQILIRKLKEKSLNKFVELVNAHTLTNLSSLIGSCLINDNYKEYSKARRIYLMKYEEFHQYISKSLRIKRLLQYILIKLNCTKLLRQAYRQIMNGE